MDHSTYSDKTTDIRHINGMVVPLAEILDHLLPDQHVRDAAKMALLKLENSPNLETLYTRLSMILAEEPSSDPWIRRARPAFLYIIYALLLWSIPMGLVSGIKPDLADAITRGMNAYLNALPEPLYALFGTAYLGYTAARTWGKVKGVDK